MTEAGVPRRIATVAAVIAILLSIAVYGWTASSAVKRLSATRSVALVGVLRTNRSDLASVANLSDHDVQRAVSALPLEARVVNVAMVRGIIRSGEGQLARWIPTLAKLGWRDTAALQNRLYVAALKPDLGQILDIGDALMRRNQLGDQVITVLALAEADPSLRNRFVQRLVDSPGWRDRYLYAVGSLRDRDQYLVRYDVLRSLQRRGVRLGRSELVSNINMLVTNDLPALGFALWNSVQPGLTRPLNDPSFARASRNDEADEESVPFEWETTSGNGFDVGAYAEEGRSALAIQWDGRGVPVFARQRTSGPAGRYALQVDVAPENIDDLSSVAFQLICPDTTVTLRQVTGKPTRFATESSVPCSYAVLEIAGDIAARAAPRQIELRGLRLIPLDRGGTQA